MMSARPPIITLTTDFGLADSYVGVMKGVLLGICPNATLVDISHLISPQDVTAGAFVLREAAPYFPPDTVHLAIVDPGVGSSRRAVAIACSTGTFVGPDNGLLTPALGRDLEGVRAVSLTRPAYWRPVPSATFHGRDIFAPVAAHLAAGSSIREVGEPISAESLARLPWPAPERHRGLVRGEVIWVDTYGNLVTNIGRGDLPARAVEVNVAGHAAGGLARTYSDRQPGETVAYFGSSGYLDIAVTGGSAARVLGAGRGSPVIVTFGGNARIQ